MDKSVDIRCEPVCTDCNFLLDYSSDDQNGDEKDSNGLANLEECVVYKQIDISCNFSC